MPAPTHTFAAAGVAAAAELALLQPLDTLKTQQQTTQGQNGLLTTMRHSRKAAGLAGLWRGFGPGLAIVVPRRGLKFMLNGIFVSWCGDGLMGSLFAGGAAGACEALAITPLETIKVQLQSSRSGDGTRHPSAWSVAAQLWRRGGAARFYTGLVPTVMKHSAHSCVYFASFRAGQSRARAELNSNVRGDLAAGFVAGCAAGTVNNPFGAHTRRPNLYSRINRGRSLMLRDSTHLPCVPRSLADVLKSRAQALAHTEMGVSSPGSGCKAPGVFGALVHLARTEGTAALFAGWGAKVARLGPGSAIIFAVYHAVLERLSASQPTAMHRGPDGRG